MSHFIPSHQFPWAVSSSNRRIDRVGGYGTVLPGQSCVQSQSRDLAVRRSLEPEAHPQPGSDGSLLMTGCSDSQQKAVCSGMCLGQMSLLPSDPDATTWSSMQSGGPSGIFQARLQTNHGRPAPLVLCMQPGRGTSVRVKEGSQRGTRGWFPAAP